jgi:hypothetical protein
MTNLPRDGREYFTWEFTGLPEDASAVEVSIGDEWHALDVEGQIGKLLVAGPEAEAGDAVVVAKDTYVQVCVNDNPEIVVRGGGWIKLT